jgi:SAM-dependent methyltransferase
LNGTKGTTETGFQPSPWVRRFLPLIRPGGAVLDMACGAGRHAVWLATLGYKVEAVDRYAAALLPLRDLPNIHPRLADLETGEWPYPGRKFDAVIVTRYLHRPLLPLLPGILTEGGVLIYETFMLGHERFGRPRNPDFLLRPDELLEAFAPSLEIVAFEQGEVGEPVSAVVQRICARKTT